MPDEVYVYKAGQAWTAICPRCKTCLAVNRTRAKIDETVAAHQCSSPDTSLQPSRPGFQRAALYSPLLATVCNLCCCSFITARLDVLLMLERIHCCPGMKKANESESLPTSRRHTQACRRGK